MLDPPPARPGGPPLVLGSVGPRMLRIGLPHVDAWNVWWSDYGNTAGGLRAVRERVEAAAAAGRPGTGRGGGDRRRPRGAAGRWRAADGRDVRRAVPPVTGSAADVAGHLAAMAAAGATHLQLVLDPITEESIETVAEALTVLDGATG